MINSADFNADFFMYTKRTMPVDGRTAVEYIRNLKHVPDTLYMKNYLITLPNFIDW